MSDTLAIVGAGGHGREAIAVARAINHRDALWSEVVVYDDRPAPTGDAIRPEAIDVVGPVSDLIAARLAHVIAVGNPSSRRTIALRIGDRAPITRLIAPTAWIGDDVDLAPGVLAYPGSTCTANIRIGLHSHLNCGAIVSHDCVVGDFVSLSPGVMLNGGVVVEDDVFIGTGAIVLPGRTVGQGAVVGAGAVVIDDVEPGSTVVGIPAR